MGKPLDRPGTRAPARDCAARATGSNEGESDMTVLGVVTIVMLTLAALFVVTLGIAKFLDSLRID